MDHQHVVRGSEVFVGGLARSTTESKIHEVFSTCGEIVEVRLIKDQKGEPKGYCFVRFAMKEAANKAVKEKSGIMLDGKKIGVLPSNEQDALYLGNLRKEWTADEFEKIVHQAFPDVASIDLAMAFSTGDTTLGQKQKNRGFAIVKFTSHAAAARAYRLGSNSDFILAANCHPVVDWAKEESEVNPEELAKIKIAFVRNLPADADENYLKKLFEPLGKLDRVVLSKKSRSPVGFVHFAVRSDLDNAIKEMNGKTIQGPNGGPSIKLLVEVARPIEKNRKRARTDLESKPATTISSHFKFSKDEQTLNTFGGPKSVAQELKYSLEEPVVADPYEAAVVSLPVAVKERLLRILRLGIATRFDINIQCLTSLKELPESTAISILDQFMLSGADRHNKAEYLSALISRVLSSSRIRNIATLESQLPSISNRVHLSTVNIATKESQLPNISSRVHLSTVDIGSRESQHPSISNRVHLSAVDVGPRESQVPGISSRVHLSAVDTLGSHAGTTIPGYELSDIYTSRYSSSLSPYPQPSRVSYGGKMEESGQDTLTSRLIYGKMEESIPTPLHRIPGSSSSSYSQLGGLDSTTLVAARDHQPTARTQVGGLDSTPLVSARDRHPTTRTQVRFDPFTGEPYKFDPFTGEPIVPESLPHHYGSPY